MSLCVLDVWGFTPARFEPKMLAFDRKYDDLHLGCPSFGNREFSDNKSLFKTFKRIGKQARRSSLSVLTRKRNTQAKLDILGGSGLESHSTSGAYGDSSWDLQDLSARGGRKTDQMRLNETYGLDKLSYNLFEYTEDELQEFVARMLFDFSPETNNECLFSHYYELVGNIRNAYNDHAYHSFRHAVDVTQAMYVLLMDENLRALLSANDPVILLLTCLLHDVGHNGRTNNVLRRSKHKLCAQYGDVSTLEHYHADLARQIIDEHNVVEMLDIELSVVDFVEELILYTDIEKHMDFMEKFKRALESEPRGYGGISSKGSRKHKTEFQKLFCGLLVKICDISNLARREEVAQRWGNQLTEETLLLYSYCQSIGLEPAAPLPPVSDEIQARRSLQFAECFVKPMYEMLGRICPTASAPFYMGLKRNTNKWNATATSTCAGIA